VLLLLSGLGVLTFFSVGKHGVVASYDMVCRPSVLLR
jgi:hypothetical protein